MIKYQTNVGHHKPGCHGNKSMTGWNMTSSMGNMGGWGKMMAPKSTKNMTSMKQMKMSSNMTNMKNMMGTNMAGWGQGGMKGWGNMKMMGPANTSCDNGESPKFASCKQHVSFFLPQYNL